MKRKIFKVTILLGILLILFCGVYLWAGSSPLVYDYQNLYRRELEGDLLLAFTIALRRNHPTAYDMTDPSQHNRLDDWMNTHKPRICSRLPHVVLSGRGSRIGYTMLFDCYSRDGWYEFTIDNVVIENMRIMDWGEVQEEFD
jgi:hypothetical protein